MAVPLAPIAWTALRLGAVAAIAYAAARRSRAEPKHIWRETALNDLPDGLEVTTDRTEDEANTHGAARFSRRFILRNGRGAEIDIAALGRIRLRRIG